MGYPSHNYLNVMPFTMPSNTRKCHHTKAKSITTQDIVEKLVKYTQACTHLNL